MSGQNSGAGAKAAGAARSGVPVFTEKVFYLEEFYGKTLLFALVPPSGERLSELDSLVRTLRELRRNQTRSILIVSPQALARLTRRLGRMAPAAAPPTFDPAKGLRSRPYPPDSSLAEIWLRLRSWPIIIAATSADDPEDLVIFAQELASRLCVLKLILLDRDGGLGGENGRRMPFVDARRIRVALRSERRRLRRTELRAAWRALQNGVGSVNLSAPRGVYEELFSFIGTGTLFTQRPYGSVRPISIDDFEEVEALIERGQHEGVLLPRSRDEIARLLPSCFGYRVGDGHLAGICSLLTEPYRRERAGEITALYTLTRFQGEGLAVELVNELLKEGRARRLRYVFACTGEERAARFFGRMRFRRSEPGEVPPAKWRGYDSARIGCLTIFRTDLG